MVIDVVVPSDCNIRKKKREKLEKYQGLKEELEKMWMSGFQVIPLNTGKRQSGPSVVGALEAGIPKLVDPTT